MSRRRQAALIGAALVVLGACSAGGASERAAAPAAVTLAPPTNATRPVPSTTEPSGAVFPLTGLPTDGSPNASRPALSVKIDNAPSARPQAGLQDADVVTEELVEGGLTRFLATYQSRDAASIGPVRSARPVDADLLNQLGPGIFAYSGAAPGEIAPARARSGAVLLDAGGLPQTFWRAPGRPAPSNLFTSTTALYQAGARPGLAPPPQLFSYATAAPLGLPAKAVTLFFSGMSTASWRFILNGAYERLQNGAPAQGTDGARITADNVVILSVPIGHTGIFDTAGNEDPLVIVTGSGRAWVVREGAIVAGEWSRTTWQSKLTLTATDGTTMTLRPGRTWIELLPMPATPAFG